jgi:hypothetical protein
MKDMVLKQMGRFGHFPKYFIPGVEKCGTTTLYNYMIQHPLIDKAQTKESFFFDKNFKKGLSWYKGFFQKPNCVDGTPTYYRSDQYLRKIKLTVQPPKSVVILREPIARFESAWNMNLANKWDKRSFDQIFADEYLNISDGYIGQGIYHKRLESIFEIFGRKNVHVMFLENLKRNPVFEMNRVFSFLGLYQFFVHKIPPQKKGTYLKRLTDKQKSLLDMIYTPANQELENLLGEPLPWQS